MKDYTSENPQYSGTIRIYDNTDPVDADSVDNVPLIQMHIPVDIIAGRALSLW